MGKETSIRPELYEISELRSAVVVLEDIWDKCQHVLSQNALDFVNQLIGILTHLAEIDGPEFCKRVFMASSEGLDLSDAERAAAEETLHSTLPILIYLDEMQRDVSAESREQKAKRRMEQSRLERQNTRGSIPAEQQRAESKEPPERVVDNGIFRELFGLDMKLYNRLKSEIGQFDPRRFKTFFNFILHEGRREEHVEEKQRRYFANLYRQLKEVVSWTNEEETEKQARRRAQWLCLQKVVQAAAPHLFPTSLAKKEAKPQILQAPALQRKKDQSPKKLSKRMSMRASTVQSSSTRSVPSVAFSTVT